MNITRKDLIQLTARMQMDIRDLNTKLAELRSWIAQLPIPDTTEPSICPDCGIHAKGERTLAEHAYHTHGGPTPAHWQDAENVL